MTFTRVMSWLKGHENRLGVAVELRNGPVSIAIRTQGDHADDWTMYYLRPEEALDFARLLTERVTYALEETGA